MNAVATNNTPVTLQEGDYQGGAISGPNTPMPNIEYVHHIHSTSIDSDTIINKHIDIDSVDSPYSDNYGATSSGGCFTSGRYTSHIHTSSCTTHKHTGNAKKGGGCYTVETKTGKAHNPVRVNGNVSSPPGALMKCPVCGKMVATTEAGETVQTPDIMYTIYFGYCFGNEKTTYSLGCGYNEGDYECGGSPLNSDYKYYRTCGKTAGQVVQAIITY